MIMQKSSSNLEENRKYCLIGIKYGMAKRGSYTVSKRFADHIGHDFRLDASFRFVEDEINNYRKFIYTAQKSLLYSFEFSIPKISKIPHIIYTREPLVAKVLNSVQNGFSAYKNMRCHKHFIPFITDFNIDSNKRSNNTEYDKPVIGVYIRVHTNPDAVKFLKQELKQTKHKIDLVTCGDNTVNFECFNSINTHYHTYDNEDFFSRITHYYFPQSAEFMDPFPNTLLEAIQMNKQIICPIIPGRNHTDGIDDILQVIRYYSTKLDDAFNNKFIDYNKINYLTFNNFKKFYNRVIVKDDFSNELEYDKFKSFEDWCGSEL